jgi:AcrR family transcriptional regulator
VATRQEQVAATRASIAGAALDLLLENDYAVVTLTAIAERAGVSHQTVLNHFESKEGAARAAFERLKDEVGSERERILPGDVNSAVHHLVAQYERSGDANVRAAMAAEQLESFTPLLDEARAGHQADLERIFGDRLPVDPGARMRAVYALHAATDVYTWKLLRRDLGLSRAVTERILADLVDGVLQHPERSQ